uniref:receptor protein-tyrosine kinase n=1 Tax=Ephydatia fluviatilis TaxID=31330 RepID=Q9Y1Y5_9METZ|nr:protein tyrosine kinase [Ephydatia fluviatilis]
MRQEGFLFPLILEITGVLSVSNTTCIELPKTSKCYGLQTQRPNYYLPQTLPFGLSFTDDNIVVLKSFSTSQVPLGCQERIVGIFCTALYPPCDNATNQPIMQCPSSCEKYQTTVNYTECTFLWNYFLQYTSIGNDIISLLQLVNCSDPSTYYFGDISNGVSSTMCYSSFNDLPPTTADSSSLDSPTATWKIVLPAVIVGTTVLVTVVICIVLVTVLARRRGCVSTEGNSASTGKSDGLDLEFMSKEPVLEHATTDLSTRYVALKGDNHQHYQTMFQSAVIKYADLKLNQEVFGEGSFSKVYRGTLHQMGTGTTEVAVKAMKSIESDAEMKSFFTECSVMQTLKHPNVLGILGMCFDSPDSIPLMVLPFMVNGNLKDYLKKHRGPHLQLETYPENLSLQMLKRICVDITRGMSYLADRRFVHRDLAARNCLLDSALAVKVGDFGLTRDIYLTNYYRAPTETKLPVKWMPPEMLQDGVSDEKTDVWSFGVTCWEVFSFGSTPYPGVDNHLMLQHLMSGLRLQKPLLCPDEIYTLMARCWSSNPEDRPTFNELFKEFSAI